MSKAFKCNACGQYFDGAADQQVGHNEALEKVLHYLLGIKFSPENQEASFYVKDLCLACAKLYCEIWTAGPESWKKFIENLKFSMRC